MQWDLKSGCIWISNGQKEIRLQMVHISNGMWNPDKWLPFCQKTFEIWTQMSSFQMVMTIAIAQPFKNLTNRNLQKVLIWIVFRLWMVGFKIPIVLSIINTIVIIPFCPNQPLLFSFWIVYLSFVHLLYLHPLRSLLPPHHFDPCWNLNRSCNCGHLKYAGSN